MDKERLRQSEQRFRAAVEAMDGILWTNNAAGEMAGEQPAWAALTEQTYDDYQGVGWSKAVHPDDAKPTIDAWKAAVAERRIFVFEHRVRRRDGQWRLCSIRAVPVFDEEGRLREWAGIHTDVTEKRASERRVRFLQPDLPAVLITGYTDAIDPGASTLPVLAKPFRAAELARAVAEAIKGSAAM